jgi:hypothetical protein
MNPHTIVSVHAGPRVYPMWPEHLGRYIVRMPMPSKDVRLTEEGKDGQSEPFSRNSSAAPAAAPEGEEPFRRPRPSWARLLHRILEVDPLLCPKCGTEMSCGFPLFSSERLPAPVWGLGGERRGSGVPLAAAFHADRIT